MKLAHLSGQTPYFLVFDRGDEVMETLRAFARERGIRGARFDAIGAFERAVVAYWNRDIRDYERMNVNEQVEVASLAGDLTIDGEEIKVHAHVVLGRRDGSAVAGHLVRGTVFPTLEMHLVAFPDPLVRKHDEETGLSLIAVGEGP